MWCWGHVLLDAGAAGALLEDLGHGGLLLRRLRLLLGLLVLGIGSEDGDLLSLSTGGSNLRLGLQQVQGLTVFFWNKKDSN